MKYSELSIQQKQKLAFTLLNDKDSQHIFKFTNLPKRGERIRQSLFIEETKEEKMKRIADVYLSKLNNYVKGKKPNEFVVSIWKDRWEMDTQIIEYLDRILNYYSTTKEWKTKKIPNFRMRRMRIQNGRVEQERQNYEQNLYGFMEFKNFIGNYINSL